MDTAGASPLESTDETAPTFRAILEARRPEYDPWLYDYCGYLGDAESARKFVRHLEDRLAFGKVDPRGKLVLDAGCGFGFALLALLDLGAAEVSGLEIYKPMLDTIAAYLPLLDDDTRRRIHLQLGDVSAMPYDDASFDTILSFEAISHYRDVDRFIAEARRVLRPGGVLIISDGNNGLNPFKRRETQRLWDAFELGPRGTRVGGLLVDHHYEDERRSFVAERFPDVPAERMAHETFGLTFDEVAAACEQYRRERSFPGKVYDRSTAPLNPGDATLIEQLYNPKSLARRLRAAGFSTRVTGYWGGASGRKTLRFANAVLTALSPVTIVTAKSYLVAARKHG